MKARPAAVFRGISSSSLYNEESLANVSRLAILLLVAILPSCATRQPLTGPWKVEIATSGGLAGLGAGTYAIDSDGLVTVVTPDRRTCSFKATDGELARIARLLEDSRPPEWAADYVPAETCCDRFSWTLTATIGSRAYTTRWIDAPEPMPERLTALASAVAWNGDPASLRHVYGSRCH